MCHIITIRVALFQHETIKNENLWKTTGAALVDHPAVAEFMNAIHMGTTATEEHVCNVVRLADGSGLLVDRTKGVLMSLTRAELASRWASGLEALGGSGAPAAPDPGPGTTMAAAMKAFEEGDLARAGEVLEALLERQPADDVVRRNLAAVRYAQGDRQAAREILGS